MARGATIYRTTLDLSHVDRDVYGEQRLTIARHPSETVERMVARILAYGLRAQEGLEFGRGVSATDEPDLWRRSGDGRVIEWIEVGQPDAKRLVKGARQSEQCRLFVVGDGAARFRAAQIEGQAFPDNLGIACICDAMVAGLAAEVDRQIHWAMTVSEDTIFVSTPSGASFECAPEIWLGSPLD